MIVAFAPLIKQYSFGKSRMETSQTAVLYTITAFSHIHAANRQAATNLPLNACISQ
jgi:hypothetical protein